MSIRANFTTSYLRRYLLMAAVGLGWAAYCAWDGLVVYPHKMKISEAWENLEKAEGLKPYTDEHDRRWEELTLANGWPNRPPGKKAHELADLIRWQYIMGAIGLAIGVPALLFFFASRGSWVEGDADGLTTSWGQTLRFRDVTRLNKTRWAKKGIARAEYTEGKSPQVFVFDDFKFERQPLGELLRNLERVLKPEQIVGGAPEGESGESGGADRDDSPADVPQA